LRAFSDFSLSQSGFLFALLDGFFNYFVGRFDANFTFKLLAISRFLRLGLPFTGFSGIAEIPSVNFN
jgi:hypothetical protein